MYKRPFLVLPGGICVPLEGDYRVEELRGEWYVLGNHSVIRFDSEHAAVARFSELTGARGPDVLAGRALARALDLDLEQDLDLALDLGPDGNSSFS